MKSPSSSGLVSRWFISAGILASALILSYAPLPGFRQTLVVVSGSELKEPLTQMEATFEKQHPNIDLKLEFEGSQDMIDRYHQGSDPLKPTVIIPASADFLSQINTSEFSAPPQGIVKTFLVGVVWPERAKALFPSGQWDWSRIEAGLQADRRSWEAIGGQKTWGSFDFTLTDPSRSNSGQLSLVLWLQFNLQSPLTTASFSNPKALDLIGLVKNAVYQPARSTDDLLQDFIAGGSNEADVAMVYESIALYRWSQANITQRRPYQIFYPNPTIETVATAAILRQGVDRKQAQAAQTFLDFLHQPDQQAVFIRFGFRPTLEGLDLKSIPNSPWAQNIPGAEVQPAGQIQPPPAPEIIQPLVKAWQDAP